LASTSKIINEFGFIVALGFGFSAVGAGAGFVSAVGKYKW